jgi:hypothetical protein
MAHTTRLVCWLRTHGASQLAPSGKWPKAVAKITEDLDTPLAFYDYPAEHWIHLRTTNRSESTLATVRLRQRVTKGRGSRAAGVAMAFKLIEAPKPAGVASTHRTWALPSAQARSSPTANSSNDPRNQEANSKSRDMPIHRS